MADDKVKLLTTEHLESIFNKDKAYADRKVKNVSDCISIRRIDGVYENQTEADSNWSEGKVFFIKTEYAFKRCVDTDSGFEDAGVEYNTDVSVLPSGITGARKGLTANSGLYAVDSGDSITFYRVSVPATNKAVIAVVDVAADEAPALVITLSTSLGLFADNCDTGSFVKNTKPKGTEYDRRIAKFLGSFVSSSKPNETWKWSNIQFRTGELLWKIVEFDSLSADCASMYVRNRDKGYVIELQNMGGFSSGNMDIYIYSE